MDGWGNGSCEWFPAGMVGIRRVYISEVRAEVGKRGGWYHVMSCHVMD